MNLAVHPCPGNWEYTDFPGHDAKLKMRSASILLWLRSTAANPQKLSAAADTRKFHAFMLKELTPADFDYYAGHYRGENLRCLSDYEVRIKSDPRVGHTAATVPTEMTSLRAEILRICQEIDLAFSAPNALFPPAYKVFRAVELCAALFVHFLEIHPYANGNGHMARFLLQTILSTKNIFFNHSFETHPRPTEPAYTEAIATYRDGNKSNLHNLLLNCL